MAWRTGTTEGYSYATAEQLQQAVAEGWHLANHTSSHEYASNIGNREAILRDIKAANDAIDRAVPGYETIMFTSPFVDPDFTPIIVDEQDQLGFYLLQSHGGEVRRVDGQEFHPASTQVYEIGRTQILHFGTNLEPNGDTSQFDQVHQWIANSPGSYYWLSLHTHDVAAACDCIEIATDRLYNSYGAGGSDEVWVAPAPEVYQYLILRNASRIVETDRRVVGEARADFALPEAEIKPLVQTLVLRQGEQGYEGTTDAHIEAYAPTSNFGSSPGLSIRTLDQKLVAISFDLSRLPPNAVVQRATLALYGLSESNPDVKTCLEALPLRRTMG